MKFRSSLLLAPVVAGLFLGGLAPAQAAAPDAVTNLTAGAVQTKGVAHTFTVTAHWTANPDATGYSAMITDNADGSAPEGKSYGFKDLGANDTSVTLTSSAMAGDTSNKYYLAVKTDGSGGQVAVIGFPTPALDTAAPIGTYKLGSTTGYLSGMITSEDDPTAEFKLTQTSGDAYKTRQVVAGDGSPARNWGLGSFALSYTEVGTYHPYVRVTDEYANVRTINLPAVRVLKDTGAPVLTITKPANPSKKSSWRTVRGTVSDAGVGVFVVAAVVAQKRAGVWWVYDFKTKKWLEGYSSWRKTGSKSKANPWAMVQPSSSAWHTSKIKGIQRGPLRVLAFSYDANFNISQKLVNQKVR